MSKYTPEQKQVGVGLDEIGLRFSLQRLPEENLSDYRRRLLLQGRDEPHPSLEAATRTINRLVGKFEERVFEISLVMDGSEEGSVPIAEDPRVEITESFLRIWSNYAETEDTPDLEINIALRGEAYFLRDIKEAIDKLSFVTLELLDTSIKWEKLKYEKSSHLRIGNSDAVADNILLTGLNTNLLRVTNIKTISFSQTDIFNNLVESPLDVTEEGDYYVDKDFGIVFSYDLGGGSCHTTTREFPYYVWWQPVTMFEFNDSGVEYLIKENLINDNGQEERLLLNAYGTRIVNDILEEYPLTWGK